MCVDIFPGILSQICGRGDTVEALSHVLARIREPGAPPGDDIVASVKPGAASIQQKILCRDNNAGNPPPPRPQPNTEPVPLSDEDFVKVKNAVRDRDERRRQVGSPSGGETALFNAGATPEDDELRRSVRSPSGVDTSLSTTVATQDAVSSTAPLQGASSSPVGGGATPVGSSSASRDGSRSTNDGIDQRLFAPVLRAILSGEGDHVLRRSLLCHPLFKTSKTVSAATTASPKAGAGPSDATGRAAPSPVGGSGGRRKGGKGTKGGKVKKRDRDRDREQEEWGSSGGGTGAAGAAGASQAGVGSSRAERQPLDASRELSRLAEIAAEDGSLQSTLILIKTLLCVADPATAGVEEYPIRSSPAPHQAGGKGGRSRPHLASGGDETGKSHAASSSSSRATYSTGLILKTAPLLRLAGRDLSNWSEITELLRREKYRERMDALRGRPSLTVCSGKADFRGRLEAKGEAAGVVTGVHVSKIEPW